MLELLIAILLGLAAPDYTATTNADNTVVTSTANGTETDPLDDSGGDTGHIPPKPPTP